MNRNNNFGVDTVDKYKRKAAAIKIINHLELELAKSSNLTFQVQSSIFSRTRQILVTKAR